MTSIDVWLIVGFAGQGLMGTRFIVQWLVSERAGRSTIPVAFWFFSIGGATILLAYALHRADPVFIVGQIAGLLVYMRNVHLIYRQKQKDVSV